MTPPGHAHLDRQRYDMACSEVASNLAENFLGMFLVRSVGNDCELIPTVKMTTRHLVEGSYGRPA